MAWKGTDELGRESHFQQRRDEDAQNRQEQVFSSRKTSSSSER